MKCHDLEILFGLLQADRSGSLTDDLCGAEAQRLVEMFHQNGDRKLAFDEFVYVMAVLGGAEADEDVEIKAKAETMANKMLLDMCALAFFKGLVTTNQAANAVNDESSLAYGCPGYVRQICGAFEIAYTSLTDVKSQPSAECLLAQRTASKNIFRDAVWDTLKEHRPDLIALTKRDGCGTLTAPFVWLWDFDFFGAVVGTAYHVLAEVNIEASGEVVKVILDAFTAAAFECGFEDPPNGVVFSKKFTEHCGRLQEVCG